MVEVQRNPLKLGLFVALFPQLIAGPIVRYRDVAAQIDVRIHTVRKFASGIERFTYGLAKKAIIANTVGEIADDIFTLSPEDSAVISVWVGIICYTLQIYFDFSGYSDMAIGLGRMFGFEFLENFNLPYISKSITEFWRRWHISLSSWFRDYVYIPLGGNRSGNVYVNLFVTFLLTGIWHGAANVFVVWGLWHGCFIIAERVIKRSGIQLTIPKWIRHLYTMMVVMIGWVFFRSDTMGYALMYLKRMFGILPTGHIYFLPSYYLGKYNSFIIIVAILTALGFHMKAIRWGGKHITKCDKEDLSDLSMINDTGENCGIIAVVKLIMIVGLFVLSIIYLMTASYNPFIYFRF